MGQLLKLLSHLHSLLVINPAPTKLQTLKLIGLALKPLILSTQLNINPQWVICTYTYTSFPNMERRSFMSSFQSCRNRRSLTEGTLKSNAEASIVLSKPSPSTWKIMEGHSVGSELGMPRPRPHYVPGKPWIYFLPISTAIHKLIVRLLSLLLASVPTPVLALDDSSITDRDLQTVGILSALPKWMNEFAYSQFPHTGGLHTALSHRIPKAQLKTRYFSNFTW